MSGRARVAAALAATALTAVAVPAAFANDHDGEPVQDVRMATRRYRVADKAIDDGYVQFFGCVHEPLSGSMGIHFVNGGLVNDAAVDAEHPEALMYEVTGNGQLSLLGAEYVVFQEAWDAANDQPPSLFGQPFMLVPEGNRYGIPAFYELHVWAWKGNPAGAYADWNPTVLCLGTEGHQH